MFARFERVEAAEQLRGGGAVHVEQEVRALEQVVVERFNTQTFAVCVEKLHEDLKSVEQAREELG